MTLKIVPAHQAQAYESVIYAFKSAYENSWLYK